jgi:hypothetical protein
MGDTAQLSIEEINEINEFGFHLSSALSRTQRPSVARQPVSASDELGAADDGIAAVERRLSPGIARALFVVKP